MTMQVKNTNPLNNITMRTRVSYLAEKLASGELSACEALNRCVDIDRARDVFELAELFKYLKLLKDWEEWSKLNDECNDWEWFQEDYFQDANWGLNNTEVSWSKIWADYDLAEQERLAPSDREIQIGKIARDLAVNHHNGSLKRNPYELGLRFCNECKLTPAEQVIFWNEYTDYNYHINCGYRYEF